MLLVFRLLLAGLLLQPIIASPIYEGRFYFITPSSPEQKDAHNGLYEFLVSLAEGKAYDSSSTEITVKDLILTATAIVPIGSNIDADNVSTCQSALGAKVKALGLIESRFKEIVLTDEETLNLFCAMIETHLHHNQSLFYSTLEETFFILDADGLLTSSRVREPAFKFILEPIFKMTVSLVEILVQGSVPEFFSNKITPSFVASLVPLFMSPIFEEHVYLKNIFEMTISFLEEPFDLALLKAFHNYIDNILIWKLPLRGVNEILELIELLLNGDILKDGIIRATFLSLVHSSIFPLYRNEYFYLVSKRYGKIIRKTLDIFYRNPSKAIENSDLPWSEWLNTDSDHFIDHPFVHMCRKKLLQNIPRGDSKNETAFVDVLETITSLNGLFHKADTPFILKSLLRHLKHTTISDFIILATGMIQVENLEDLDETLLRKVLNVVWSSDFTIESSYVRNSAESYVTLVLDDLKKRFKDLYFEFIAVGELRIDNRSDSAP